MEKQSKTQKIAFLGDYLPRKCGIATFTTDLRCAVAAEVPASQCPVVPVNDLAGGYDYPTEVRFEISEQDLPSYLRAADFLNITDVDVICVQHEFGIFGGPAGSHLLALLRELRMPIVTTLHTILREPNADQMRVMRDLTRLSTRLVVMTERGRQLLRDVYRVPEAKIDLIPHGIPDMPFADPNYFKDEFGVAGKQVLLTFGLLSPNKGVEYGLRALPDIIQEFPNIVYIVLGQTHPNLLRDEGEAYRLSLERLAKDLGVQKHVVFFNRFVELDELMRFIGAADIYLTPYLTETQITSGTLAYAFGAGNAVVSTPYWHAAELLTEERGKLVPFRDSGAISGAVRELLRDEPLRHSMRKNAYRLGRDMAWSHVAKLYLQSFERARHDHSFVGRKPSPIKTLDEQPAQLPELKLDHLFRMSDGTGIFQHASFTVPNFAEGYCTDDNARALVLALMLQQLGHAPRVHTQATTYAAFLNHAFDRASRRFHNFMSFDRRWLDEVGSEDCQGHALWALGLCVRQAGHGSFQMLAAELFEQALPIAAEFTSPRAWAFTLIGIDGYLRRLSGDRRAEQIRESLAAKLIQRYADAATDEWQWFEEMISYANAKLPHAMILSGRCTNNERMLEIGLKTLRWLTRLQTSENGSFRPIGSNGFYLRGKERALFDQQPIEAQVTVSACIEAFHATSDMFWVTEARRAFEWFLGRNDLGLALYDSTTGGCRDGLHMDRVSQNQGAESTLAFLLALAEMQTLQNTIASFKELPPELDRRSRRAVNIIMPDLTRKTVHAKRIGPTLTPDRSRVLLRPFRPSTDDIARRIAARVMALPDTEVDRLLNIILGEFGNRHEQVDKLFHNRFAQVRQYVGDRKISTERQSLIGAHFTHEYSPESAALFNPSIVPHPDQAGLPGGALRFILSLRATGEGHISSITFRVGVVSAQHRITLTPPVSFATEPEHVPNAAYDKALFTRKLQELGIQNRFCRSVLDQLDEAFTMGGLRRVLAAERKAAAAGDANADRAARGMLLLAESNYEVRFASGQPVSQRVIFPSAPSQSNGIEDARFVRFQNDDGAFTYYATYTAYDGKIILPQLLETSDFLHFKFITLNGPAVQNKGMALFPRKINGHYAMLSRQDDENILLMFSDNIHFWHSPKVLLAPSQPWEFIKMGNCGSPIETSAGWLVLSHGVGAMRKYCLGAFLLDLKDPSRVIGRLREPLLAPNEAEREGYVPNVVYTCGALLHERELVIPYAMSDSATSFATVSVDELLAGME